MTSADVLPSPRALPRPAVFGLGALVAVWAATIAGGWWLMTSYAFKTNPPRAAPPRAWPVESMLPRLPGQEAVLVFLHPRCPCSRATIGELERVLALPSDAAKPQVFVVATVPGSRAEWGEAPLVRRAAELPGAKLWIDAGGAEAARFGAVT
ncbi:MAG TPA: hypothetical protein PKC18_04480, partial [Lacipirellulaceae bacterium]|nr:hypothetical protein [Lacipirellulaceae bacterium]